MTVSDTARADLWRPAVSALPSPSVSNPVPEAAAAGLSPWSTQTVTNHGGKGRFRLNRVGHPRTLAADDRHQMTRLALPLLKGACSGFIWSLFPLLLFRSQLQRFPATWILAASVLTGLIITLLILPLRDILQTWKRRLISSLPILAVAQGAFSFFLTVRATWEGTWPERWIELTLAIY